MLVKSILQKSEYFSKMYDAGFQKKNKKN